MPTDGNGSGSGNGETATETGPAIKMEIESREIVDHPKGSEDGKTVRGITVTIRLDSNTLPVQDQFLENAKCRILPSTPAAPTEEIPLQSHSHRLSTPLLKMSRFVREQVL